MAEKSSLVVEGAVQAGTNQAGQVNMNIVGGLFESLILASSETLSGRKMVKEGNRYVTF